MELAQHMKQLYWPKSRTEHYEDFERLLKTFQVFAFWRWVDFGHFK